MKKFNLWLAAVSAVSLVSLTAVAQTASVTKCEPNAHHQKFDGKDNRTGFGERRRFEKNRPLIEAALELTDTQKKTLADARTAQEPAIRELHEKLRAAHEALDKAEDSNADDVTLTRLSNDVGALIAQQEVTRIKLHKQFLSLLTPEQKQKLEAFKAERKNSPHRKERHHQHGEKM